MNCSQTQQVRAHLRVPVLGRPQAEGDCRQFVHHRHGPAVSRQVDRLDVVAAGIAGFHAHMRELFGDVDGQLVDALFAATLPPTCGIRPRRRSICAGGVRLRIGWHFSRGIADRSINRTYLQRGGIASVLDAQIEGAVVSVHGCFRNRLTLMSRRPRPCASNQCTSARTTNPSGRRTDEEQHDHDIAAAVQEADPLGPDGAGEPQPISMIAWVSLDQRGGAVALAGGTCVLACATSAVQRGTSVVQRGTSAPAVGPSALAWATCALARGTSAHSRAPSALAGGATNALARGPSALQMATGAVPRATSALPRGPSALQTATCALQRATHALAGATSALAWRTSALAGAPRALFWGTCAHDWGTGALQRETSALQRGTSALQTLTSAPCGTTSALARGPRALAGATCALASGPCAVAGGPSALAGGQSACEHIPARLAVSTGTRSGSVPRNRPRAPTRGIIL